MSDFAHGGFEAFYAQARHWDGARWSRALSDGGHRKVDLYPTEPMAATPDEGRQPVEAHHGATVDLNSSLGEVPVCPERLL